MSEVKYLVKVDPDANNSKYYKMIPNGGSFKVEYGRLGNTSFQTAEYSISQWNKKYKEKIKKGYEDKSELIQELVQDLDEENENNPYLPIPDKAIQTIVDRLQNYANEEIKRHYKVSSQQVTNTMIEEAQKLINSLNKFSNSIEDFNNVLVELFKVIPRKMKTVKENLATKLDDIPNIYQREQDLLDVMKGQVVQVKMKTTIKKEDTKKQNILEAMGLKFESVSEEDVKIIKKELGDIQDRYYNAWKVENVKTQKVFDEYMDTVEDKTTKLLFHGSRSENWWSIINSGLVLRPNAVISGKMFGSGIYFAPKARKSLGYTSLDGSYWVNGNSNCGFMAIFEIYYGNPYITYDNDMFNYNFNYSDLKNLGKYDSVHAKAGKSLRNDEIIVYQECQCTIKYLIELR